MKYAQRLYSLTQDVPKGKVTTYCALAQALGRRRLARHIGNLLHINPYKSVPCHRVVRSDGTVGGYANGTEEKEKILREEGVEIVNGRVDLKRFGHSF